ncbi:hypothetical protein GUJ93_ZPchr0006g44041 [Zizania palustris]|uniref:C2H2-type domain-containing protein n=1 Tax=Zizania palustris TaxID=103762 RepID=A0A8J5W3N4_ZIZPA|nr:hypothetical protein GUJ93_ZPchr0006g44041 [Zizania palustris]
MEESSRRMSRREPWSSMLAWPPRSYPCGFCKREFRSAQALGGHMNVHRRDRARLRHAASPPPAPPRPRLRLPPPPPKQPPLLPNLNYPPPARDYYSVLDQTTTAPELNLELGPPAAADATTPIHHDEDDDDDGSLDLELRLSSAC